MKFIDKIYGEIEVVDPTIRRLIKTKPFQRLKRINQYGGVNFVYKNAYQTSRFEHSIGVWYSTCKLGADLETQIAALLHDVGHFTFSHLVDMAKESELESEHEFVQGELEGWDEIEIILKEKNIRVKDVDKYKLIKNSLPDIGTDRLDYAIRDFEAVVPQNDNFGAKALSDIELIDGEIVFKTKSIAKEFAKRGNRAMWHVIYDPQIVVVYQAIVEILRIGMKDGWITKKDLLSTDDDMMKLIKSKSQEYKPEYLKVFTHRYSTVVTENDEPHDFKAKKLKARYFDPRVMIKPGETKRISEIDPEAKLLLEKYSKIFEDAKKEVGLKLMF